jgi:peptidoglycan lytic transglycosylase G
MRLQKWLIFWGAFFFLLSLGSFLAYEVLIKDYSQSLTDLPPVTVVINPGQSARDIGKLLEKEQIIDSAFTFYINALLRQQASHLKAGEYKFSVPRSIESVITQLVQGKVLYHKITIPEGLTIKEVKTLLLKEDKLEGSLANTLTEGSLLPETYYFTRGERRDVVLKRMQKALEHTLQYYWLKRQHETILKSPHEVLILASIVEKETSKPSERPHIAAVFLNRLKQKMPLQADPTVIYGIEQLSAHPFERPLTSADLAFNTPYNTYLNTGLPPQPICNPGQASIEAALNPMITQDLYFVADGQGGHVFSETLKDHQTNHARWRKIKQERKEAGSPH